MGNYFGEFSGEFRRSYFFWLSFFALRFFSRYCFLELSTFGESYDWGRIPKLDYFLKSHADTFWRTLSAFLFVSIIFRFSSFRLYLIASGFYICSKELELFGRRPTKEESMALGFEFRRSSLFWVIFCYREGFRLFYWSIRAVCF